MTAAPKLQTERYQPFSQKWVPVKRYGLESLSPRELEILKLLASGKACGEIASMFGCKPITVRTHRERLMEKLHMQASRYNVQLTHFALERGLVTNNYSNEPNG